MGGHVREKDVPSISSVWVERRKEQRLGRVRFLQSCAIMMIVCLWVSDWDILKKISPSLKRPRKEGEKWDRLVREREREMERKIVNRLTKINRVTSIYAPTIFFTSFSFCLPEYLLNNFSIYLFLSSSMPLYNIFLSLPNHISICSSVFFFFFLFYLEFMPFFIRLSAFNLFFLRIFSIHAFDPIKEKSLKEKVGKCQTQLDGHFDLRWKPHLPTGGQIKL